MAKTKKEAKGMVIRNEDIVMMMLREQGMNLQDIADHMLENYDLKFSTATISRRIDKVKSIYQTMKKAIGADMVPPPQAKSREQPQPQAYTGSVAMRPSTNNNSGQGMNGLIARDNPFELLENFSEFGKVAFQAGVVPASAIACLAKGFTDDSISMEDKGKLTATGAAGFAVSVLGFFEALKAYGVIKPAQARYQEPEDYEPTHGAGFD